MLVSDIFKCFLRLSIEASFLICIVLLIKLLLRNRMGARWHYVIWILPALKLLLPYTPKTVVSVFNLFTLFQNKIGLNRGFAGEYIVLNSPSNMAFFTGETAISKGVVPVGTLTEDENLQFVDGFFNRLNSPFDYVALVWIVGIVVLAVYLLLSNVKFRKFIASNEISVSSDIANLLYESRMALKIGYEIKALVVKGLKGPALFGLFRPVLLIPDELEGKMDVEELRHVILHELGHIKQKDLVINWIAGVLTVLHWFNPIIWFAFARMRLDREISCDAYVLWRSDYIEQDKYAQTILKAVKIFNGYVSNHFITGILGSKAHMRKRIVAIVSFEVKKYNLSFIATALFALLSVILLTGAIKIEAVGDMSPGGDKRHLASGNTLTKEHDTNDAVLSLLKTSEHFKFYYNKSDENNIDKLVKSLESNYITISECLGHKLDFKLLIKVWPDQGSFREATGMPEISYKVVSSCDGHTMNILSPSYKDRVDIQNVGVHDLTHIFIQDINPINNVIWVHEGIESYVAREIDSEWLKNYIGEVVRNNRIPNITDLSGDTLYYYEFSYTIVEFIIKECGYESINDLIKAPYDFEKVFGFDENEFMKRWVQYLKKHYT
ncbi:MAG: M48 family metalloprotease [Clostridia bacterium]|nr:M48 family metalloprotease [Clostridia bacterium]